jgi:hypothetical protein
MDLNEWLKLSSNERNEIRRKWCYEWSNWSHLLFQAVERFASEYGKHPNVSLISAAYTSSGKDSAISQDILTSEPKIVVTTTLRSPETIRELPARFAHFAVEQNPFGDTVEFYIKTWTDILTNLLGWPEEKINNWILKNHSEDLSGKNGLFTHETPCYYVAQLFLPDAKMLSLNSSNRIKYLEKIQRVLDGEFSYSRPINNIDWLAIRNKINDILGEIGISLP